MIQGWHSIWDLWQVSKAQESHWIPSAGRRVTRNYKVWNIWLESASVCVAAHFQKQQITLPPLPSPLFLHTIFSPLHTQAFPREAWFTAQWNYGKGKLPTQGGWREAFASHRLDAGDALWILQMEMICLLKGKLWRARLWYALSPVWRSKRWTSIKNPEGQILQREIKREERLSAAQPCGPCCGRLWGPGDLALLTCWASVLALALTRRGNTILKSFIISSFPLLNNTWR